MRPWSLSIAARRIPCASLSLAVAALVIYANEEWMAALQFERHALQSGEIWRIVTGHWTHWSWNHLSWDLAAFVGLAIACERMGRARFLLCTSLSCLFISLAVWYWLPDMETYRGLSGINSALFSLLVFRLLWDRRQNERVGVLLPLILWSGFVAKTAYEVQTGRAFFVETDVSVVVLAHIAGALMGLASAVAPDPEGWARRVSRAGESPNQKTRPVSQNPA
jgi:rhomboid family GlyGly-CTERM serine protease